VAFIVERVGSMDQQKENGPFPAEPNQKPSIPDMVGNEFGDSLLSSAVWI